MAEITEILEKLTASIEDIQVIEAQVEDIPVIEVSLSNPTYKGEKGNDGAQGPRGFQGPKGDPGIWVGKTEPVDEDIKIWIDELTPTEMTGYLTKDNLSSELSSRALSNIEIERLLGGH